MQCSTLFCPEIVFDGIYTVSLQNPFDCNSCCLLLDLFCRDLCTFCAETNYAQDFIRGEKMTNIMYGWLVHITHFNKQNKNVIFLILKPLKIRYQFAVKH